MRTTCVWNTKATRKIHVKYYNGYLLFSSIYLLLFNLMLANSLFLRIRIILFSWFFVIALSILNMREVFSVFNNSHIVYIYRWQWDSYVQAFIYFINRIMSNLYKITSKSVRCHCMGFLGITVREVKFFPASYRLHSLALNQRGSTTLQI